MSKIVRIVIGSSTSWTSIQVPAGSALVWAEPASGVVIGLPGGGTTTGIATYWKTSEFSYGDERCLIRRAFLQPVPTTEQPDLDYVEAGIPGAEATVNSHYLIWWKKSMYDAFPPNPGPSA
ncbi:hypothetical protein [Nocardia jiangsuensis]|uniref:Uncharacterized protein n=1 Tax=Nocardia jiangsuensis TaxID=1691563 RepID=A0ABV8DU61_9NOCA